MFAAIATLLPLLLLVALHRWLQGRPFDQPQMRCDGRVAIVTGCNTGIGRQTALELARRGARVYMACRNAGACERARRQIVQSTGNTAVFGRSLDLADQRSIRAFVKRFQRDSQHLHILVNNAGCVTARHTVTADRGHETQFATNHLGPFLLTTLLLDRLRASAPSRIVTVSSRLHRYVRLQRHNLQSDPATGAGAYHLAIVYARTKLANVLFTRQLAHRLAGSGVTANALHPGMVGTRIWRQLPGWARLLLWPALRLGKTVIAGAQQSVALAVDPSLAASSGGYWEDMRCVEPSAEARDAELGEWLWAQSEALTQVAV